MIKTHLVSQLDVNEFEECINNNIAEFEKDGWKLKDIKFSTIFRDVGNTAPFILRFLYSKNKG